jgi:hypothetical protein
MEKFSDRNKHVLAVEEIKLKVCSLLNVCSWMARLREFDMTILIGYFKPEFIIQGPPHHILGNSTGITSASWFSLPDAIYDLTMGTSQKQISIIGDRR